jgi:hypothetical protein
MPLARGHLEDGRRQQGTGAGEVRTDGIARFQTDYGGPDAMALTAAQRINDYLMKAWEPVVGLHLAFEPRSQNRIESEIRGLLNDHDASISDLERIVIDAVESLTGESPFSRIRWMGRRTS